MKWVLIFVYIYNGKPDSIVVENVSSYQKCEEVGHVMQSKFHEDMVLYYTSFICVER